MVYPLNQTANQRASQDTESFRKSGLAFWAFEVAGVAVFGVGGALAGFWQTPPNSSAFGQFAWPTIGGGLGIVLGFVMVFLIIYLWNLFRAPYRQRDEARNMVKRFLSNPFLIKIEGLHAPIPKPDNSQAILGIELTISNPPDEPRSISKCILMILGHEGGTGLNPIRLEDYSNHTKGGPELVVPLYFLPGETKKGLISFAVDKPIDVSRKDKILYIYDNRDVHYPVPIDINTMTEMAKESFARSEEYHIG